MNPTTTTTHPSAQNLTAVDGTFTGDVSVGDDLSLASDGAIINFGADSEVTLTHVADTGLLMNDKLSISTSDNDDQLELISTDADASGGPAVRFYRNSSSPADNDSLLTMRIEGNNDNSQLVVYNRLRADIIDASDGTEDSSFHIFNMMAGTERTMFSIKPDEVVFNEESRDVDFRIESTDNANMFFVDGANDRIGIGTNAPGTGSTHQAASKNSMHIYNGDSGAASGDGYHGYSNLVIEQLASLDGGGINIVGGTSSLLQLAFGDSGDNNVGVIYYTNASNHMSFLTNAGERFRIASDGTLTGSDTDGIGSLSDERLKKNIKDYTHDLESFKKLKPKTFDWKNPSEHGDKSGVRGFIAQDLLDADSYTVYQEPVALPEYDNKDSHTEGDGSDYDLISPNDKGERLSYASKLGGNDAMYVSVIQQLIARIEALESK